MYIAQKISYFGDEFSHTHAAAVSLFGGQELVPCSSISGVIKSVYEGQSKLAVVPLENSIEGTVNESIDAIAKYSLYIVKELPLPIHHSLIVLTGVGIADIKRVYSHPQALSQCREYLQGTLPGAQLEAVAYTSMGLKKLDSESGAIALHASSGEQHVLAQNIEDCKNNVTRFVVVSSSPLTSGAKASVMVSTPDKVGALAELLRVLADLNVNLSHLESRPNREKLGGYNFFIDFETNGKLNTILEALSNKSAALKFLGSY